MARPTRPDVNIPAEFAPNGVKEDFVAEKLLNGFDEIDPDILAGDNLNKFIDDVYKVLNYALSGIEDIYAIGLKKEVHIRPETELSEDGYYYWTIEHNFGHSNIITRLIRVSDGAVLWGEAYSITDTTVVFKSKNHIEAGTTKAILIG